MFGAPWPGRRSQMQGGARVARAAYWFVRERATRSDNASDGALSPDQGLFGVTCETQRTIPVGRPQKRIPSLLVALVGVVRIVARRALHLVPLERLNTVRKHPPAVALGHRGLVEPGIERMRRERHRKRVIVAQIAREVADARVVGPTDPSVRPGLAVVALPAAIAPGRAF